MDIQSKKIELIQWLTSLNDSSIIDELMKLRKKEAKDWWLELSNQEKDSIEKGIRDAENGKLNPHSEVKKLYDKWL
jgi:hypothetical protein